ncbi:methyltransferase like 14, transcription regulator [Rhodotorula toruloides]|uniref:Methyltransferase like 14, transcription regulator n=1 Tax=Rhodotorula toruloides TaxID=5286 RepID=A0A511KK36_RHOTO|nr:methyltransferase like 14, transcription regulator [Rhodotorula toruloides]
MQVPDEETIRNDYSGQYPKLASLLTHKHTLTASPQHSIPPTYFNLPSDSSSSSASAMFSALASLRPAHFDCLLLTPPPSVTFDELASLEISRLAATPGFIWLWVGSGQAGLKGSEGGGVGLEKGRELLTLWGYRRCEDIVWLKTNKKNPEGDLPTSLFQPTLEHCLMGIRGTVRRSTDSFFVHCNVDTDVIVWEGDDEDPDLKPPEIQTLIENFCLGTRRLHLYGSPRSLRRGWLTVPSASSPPFSSESPVPPVENEGTTDEQKERWGAARQWSREEWEARWKRPVVPGSLAAEGNGPELLGKVETLLPFVEELDALRPKSPPQRNGLPSSGGLGRGRGAGLGITRSGLVGQAANASALDGTVGVNGLGRGRGRGRELNNGEHEAGYNIVPRPLPRQPPTTMYGPSLQAFTPQQQYFVGRPSHSNSAPPYPYHAQLVLPPPPPPFAQYAYLSQPSTTQFYGVPPPPPFLSGYPQQPQAQVYPPPLHYPAQQQHHMPTAQGYYTPPYPASVQPSPVPAHPSLPNAAYASSMSTSSSSLAAPNPQLATQYFQQQMQTLALGQSTSSNSTAPSDAGSSAPAGELVYPISSRSRSRERTAESIAADGRFADARE